MSREVQARFCERLGVRFPGATRLCVLGKAPAADMLAAVKRLMVLLPGLFDDGFPGLFRVMDPRISRTDRSLLPEGRDVAAVANGRWRIAAMA